MVDDLAKALADLTRRLVALDPALAADLRAVARAFLAATEGPPPTPVDEPEPEPAGVAGEAPSSTEAPPPGAVAPSTPDPGGVEDGRPDPPSSPPPPPRPELRFGWARPAGVEIPTDPGPGAPLKAATTDADLPGIEARCRLKAEGARWAAGRRRRQAEGVDHQAEIAPRDREILDRARQLPDCFLWMNMPSFSPPRDLALLEDVAVGFEAVADSVALIRAIRDQVAPHRESLVEALDVMAEAQSALRVAVGRVAGQADADQFRAYDWLRATADRERHYIRRHMKLEDPADPARLAEVEARIEAVEARDQEGRRRAKLRKKRLGLLRHKAKTILEGSGGEYDWRRLVEAVDELVGDGVPPSDLEIREALLPVVELMPDLGEVPAGFALALREVDRFLADRVPSTEDRAARAPTAEVREAERLLDGRGVFLIGGQRRPGAEAALKAALGIGELTWMVTKEHQSIEDFRPFVARPGIALVLLAIRWSSHSFGDVKRFCDLHGKPLVRLPAGYNPNQVAAQILAQCSEQLKGP